MNTSDVWQTVLSDLELQVSKAIFQTFLSKTILLSLEKDTATIGCRVPLLISLIEKRYASLIKKSLDEHTKTDIRLVFTASPAQQTTPMDGPLFSTSPLETYASVSLSPSKTRLNPDYTFDNFAVSSSNQMAYAAGTAVAKNPGVSYNPLFLYGGVGVGKTHLMQAIGHAICKEKPKARLIYCTGEEFTNEIIEAIRTKTTAVFKKKYRAQDVLLIDDVQFIAGKYAIQEEFFHTFNAIQQSRGQIIMTSDKPPEEMHKLETRLRSRFEGGLIIDIGPPDFELRSAILLIKIKKRGYNINIEHAKLIAANVEDTRKLEGVLIRIATESETRGVPVDESLIKNVLGKSLKTSPLNDKIDAGVVIKAVAEYYNLKLSQLKGEKRDRFLALPRQILYYLLRVEAHVPLIEIGNLLGGRDHTTVLYGVRKISTLLSTNETIRGDVLGIKERF